MRSGHHWDTAGCPVYRGAPNSEVDLYTALCGWTADSVLIREVPFTGSVLYREAPLYCNYKYMDSQASVLPQTPGA